ncbi:hypothetical protein SAMN02787142_5512 [Burkholderia sp. WP9]|uniref:hypothetical protein n=1 Tax=Burkholderia sp. WP9 TaxID=1500263 RepID=UPI0008962052|nr:hypothetical protein [Burkholderia sp. WP9]SEE92546.1 hypothetical protein SAMN02787142_5512 [Burkholderia sp. WP9]
MTTLWNIRAASMLPQPPALKIPKIHLSLAVHHQEERYVDAAPYLDELKLHDADGQMARCPFCRREMMIVEDVREQGLQFLHRQHFSLSPCPLTTSNIQPPVLFARGIRNIEVEGRNRDTFIANWRTYFAVMADQVKTLSVERFVNLVSIADALNLWSYSDLAMSDMPFILLVLAEVERSGLVLHTRTGSISNSDAMLFETLLETIERYRRNRHEAPS